MTHYVDISLHTDPDLARHVLMDELFGRLHRALAGRSVGDIAVTFPGYSLHPPGFGSVLRLLGPAARLDGLLGNSAGGLRLPAGMAHVSELAPVPPNAAHRTLRRVQVASSAERLRRRQMRRHGIDYQEAVARIPNGAESRLRLPFITLHSASTGQRFPMFLSLGALEGEARAGTFNAYGLSAEATVPWF